MTKAIRKPKMVGTTEDLNGLPRHHFFVSSMATWKVGYDLAELIDTLKREGYPFNVWLVPGAKDTDYEINFYAPQVEGAVWLNFFGNPERT